jgi:hypothetical protein
MFTVKHIQGDDEHLYAAHTVRAERREGLAVYLECVDGERVLRDGVVYVMNEAGATVSKYVAKLEAA